MKKTTTRDWSCFSSAYQYQRWQELTCWAFAWKILHFVDTNRNYLWTHNGEELGGAGFLWGGTVAWLRSLTVWAPPLTTPSSWGWGAPEWVDVDCSNAYELLLLLHFFRAPLHSWRTKDEKLSFWIFQRQKIYFHGSDPVTLDSYNMYIYGWNWILFNHCKYLSDLVFQTYTAYTCFATLGYVKGLIK